MCCCDGRRGSCQAGGATSRARASDSLSPPTRVRVATASATSRSRHRARLAAAIALRRPSAAQRRTSARVADIMVCCLPTARWQTGRSGRCQPKASGARARAPSRPAGSSPLLKRPRRGSRAKYPLPDWALPAPKSLARHRLGNGKRDCTCTSYMRGVSGTPSNIREKPEKALETAGESCTPPYGSLPPASDGKCPFSSS